MEKYTYSAKDTSGKNVTGTMEAESEAGVIKNLRAKGLTVLNVSTTAAKSGRRSRRRKVKLEDVVVFSRQLSTMVDAGLPILQGLEIMQEQIENPAFRDVITDIKQQVEGGKSLSEAMSRHMKIFGTLYVNMVKAGEASGMLDEILDRVSSYLEKMNVLKRKVKSAMVYPISVTCIAIVITTGLIIKVIPTFRDIFDSFDAELPGITLFLLALSDFLNAYLLWVILGLIIFSFLFVRYKKTEAGALYLDGLALKLPIFGVILRKVAVSKFTRTLSTLTKSGVNILEALEITAHTSGNKLVEKVVLDTRTSIKEGESIAVPLARGGVFPPMVIRMISVGEQTGALEEMLGKISDFYDDEVDAAVTALTSLIEPLLISFLGIVIGGIVIAMFLPIFQLSTIV